MQCSVLGFGDDWHRSFLSFVVRNPASDVVAPDSQFPLLGLSTYTSFLVSLSEVSFLVCSKRACCHFPGVR